MYCLDFFKVSWLFTYFFNQLDNFIYKFCKYSKFSISWLFVFSNSVDIKHFQSQLIVYISKVSLLFRFSNSADCLHFQSLLLALVCQYLYSSLHYLGYEKILGLLLKGDRQDRTKTITRSASWRFLALKKWS